MPQKDFILRVIEEAVDALAQILGLRDAGRPEQALRLVDRTARRFIGLDLQQLDFLPYEALKDLLSPGGRLDLPRFLLLAELRRLEGEIRDDLYGTGAGRRQSILAMRLFLEVAESKGLAGLGDYREQLERVAGRLAAEAGDDPAVTGLLMQLRALQGAQGRRGDDAQR
jgi:hypothetical protein